MLSVIVTLILHSTLFTLHLSAQSEDPALAALVESYKVKAENMYKAQEGAMLTESAGHIWLESEESEIYNLQKQFDDYITSFRNVIVYAAQIYGFYNEIDQLITNMHHITSQIGDSPVNPFAVALSARRNDIYIDIIQTATGIVNNIRHACIDSKMTQKERIDLIFDVRPRLQTLNRQLYRLSRYLKYTDLTDVWREIRGRTHTRADKTDIIRQSFADWRGNGKKIKP